MLNKRKKRFKLRRVNLRDENEKELRTKIIRISNDLGFGEELKISKDVYVTHCPYCNKKNVLMVSLDITNSEIEYKCNSGCNSDDIKSAIAQIIPYARPWIAGFF